jgi:FADH2 O2-dependent halogenase
LNNTFDLAIVGSGFAGSLLAMIARRLGRSVILLEKGRHPRFAIGESTTPLTNLLLEELAHRYDLPRLLPLSKWGSWQRAYANVACGLKRGFTFYHHTFGQPFTAHPDHGDQLLVAASPHDEIADTHWYRPDFDHFLVREAQSLGVDYFDEVALRSVTMCGNEVELEGERHNQAFSARARFVIDATGPRGFLHHALQLPEIAHENLPPTQGLYTHFRGVRRLSDMGVSATDETPPYPVDDAAVHHVFDGGWIWVLRFNNELTSAGVAATDTLADDLRLAEGASGWQRLLERLPTVAEQFSESTPQFDFIHARRLSFRSGSIIGNRWALLPSAAGFIDPLLSTGFPLTLLGISRLAEAIEQDWGSERFEDRLRDYAVQTNKELLAAERLVAALYASMVDFPLFMALSRLYFAAVSFAETARRLGKPQLANSFLLNQDPRFGPQSADCCAQAMRGLTARQRERLIEQVYSVIEPFDVAGLSDRGRRNWYPVNSHDLHNAAYKLGATQEEIDCLLCSAGFFK